LDAKE